MNTVPKKRDTREWKWGDQAVRPQSESAGRRWPGEDRREPSRLERSARMRSARLLEPSRRVSRHE